MITTNFLNQHTLSPSQWNYNTFGYGFDIALWNRVEVAYVCVLMHGTSYYDTQPDVPVHWVNQDRHLCGKLLLLRDGEFGVSWMPNIAVGVSDIDKGMFRRRGREKENGYFTRLYIVVSKSFHTPVGEVGSHFGYQWNPRVDFPINAPCVGVDWKPTWLQTNWLSLDLIAEYDSRTFNTGFIASFWDKHFEVMFDLQALKWVSFGLRYKMYLSD